MTIKIREYDTLMFSDTGKQVQMGCEPGVTRELTSGTKAKLKKDTIAVLVSAADGATWDVNTSALVDSSSGMPVSPYSGMWLGVKQLNDMYIEVTES